MRACELAVVGCVVLLGLCGRAAFAQGRAAGAKPPPPAPGTVRRIKVVADKAPDCSSLKSIVRSVTRGCKTNDEKAIAIYNFLRLANYHRAYPSEKGGIAALKLLNVYGWSLCGGQHAALTALWRAAGWKWRFVGWQGHTTVEVFYDGQWHYFDTFLKIYVWKPYPSAPGGRTIASQADIAANPALITEGLIYDQSRKVCYQKDNQFEIIGEKANWTAPAFLVCGDSAGGVISGVKGRKPGRANTSWMGIKHAEDGYSTDLNLAPGFSLTLTWDAIEGAYWWSRRKEAPHHTCGDKDYRNCPAIGPVLEPYARSHPRGARTFASGRLRFAADFANEAFLSSLAARENVKFAGGKLTAADAARPASITVLLQSPYVMSRATGQAAGSASAEISLDGGKSFRPIELKDFSGAVAGRYSCRVRLTFGTLKSLKLEAIVQHNRCALPYLSPGRNEITVSAAGAKRLGSNRLVVTYAYRQGHRYRSYEQLAEMDAEVARAHKAVWSEAPTVVQKSFAAKDLPATFHIDVPTPKDKHPVYPRMLLLRREVVAPGSAPLPLPSGAAPPKMGADDVLKTMPNPFHMGIAKPPKKIARPTVTRRIPLQASHVVDMAGRVYGTEQFIKWRKDGSEAWVMLMGAELKGLPQPRDIARARIILPVRRAHEQAPTKIAAVMLKAPFEKAKAYDFKNLGGTLGTAIVPKTPAGEDFDPPKDFQIDVTRGIKRLAAGQVKFHGFAIRTVPDRGVDDGWTVRVNLSTTAKPRLEIDVYTGK